MAIKNIMSETRRKQFFWWENMATNKMLNKTEKIVQPNHFKKRAR